jgi:FkbM family methyltransferase
MRLLIDVGCNVLQGFKKLLSIERITTKDKKIFVEANPECWEYLELALSTVENSYLIKKALDTSCGTAELITRADNKTDMAATIVGKHFIERSLDKWNIKVRDFNTYKIPTTTLEEIINSHRNQYESVILKLDAEGVEYSILEQIIQNNLPIDKIYCEFHIHNEDDEKRRQNLIRKLEARNITVCDWE